MAKKKILKKREDKTKIEGEKEEIKTGDSNKKQNKQLIAVLVGIAVVFIIIFAVWAIVQSSKKFNYEGIKFEKILYDKLPLYYTKIAVYRADGERINYNLYLRNDPRMNDVSVDGNIKFRKGLIYVTIDKDVGNCQKSNLALVNLGSFLAGMGFKATGATSDLSLANETGYPWVNCENSINNTVISIENSTEEGIEQKGDCYILKIKDCDMINVAEKFIVETIRQSWISV